RARETPRPSRRHPRGSRSGTALPRGHRSSFATIVAIPDRIVPYDREFHCANAFVVQMHKMEMSNLRIGLTQPRVSRCIRAGTRSAFHRAMLKIAKPRKLRLSV